MYCLVWICISIGSYGIFHVKYCEVPCISNHVKMKLYAVSAPSKISRKHFCVTLAISAHYLVQLKRGAYIYGKTFTVLLKPWKTRSESFPIYGSWAVLYVCLSVCMYVCMYVYVYVCMFMCMYVCLCVCMYVYMYYYYYHVLNLITKV